MFVLITSHAYTHHCISLSLTCWFSGLYILLIVFGHGVLITFSSDSHSFCVGMSDISCTLLDCMMHVCPSSTWLHVVCLCGSHFYPPISSSLGFGHPFHPGSHYCKCEIFYVLALWPSRRSGVGSSNGLYLCLGAFWRWSTLWCRLESDHWRHV